MIVRLDDDGDAPRDNPFWRAGRTMGGEVGENVQKIFAYGIRNSFGMAFDPQSGDLWEQENGDDSFSELNRVPPGMNSGWIQIMGPVSRIAQFKAIETDPTAPQPFAPNGYFGLQQTRWLPTNIADTPAEALSRLFMLPGSRYSDPELSWKFEVAPGGIGFLDSDDLGRKYEGDLFMGGARDFLEGGHLFRLDLTRDRRDVDLDDPRLEDRVADNVNKWEITESESLLFGRNFGVGTDIQTGPDGDLYVVSLSHGTVYEIHRPRRPAEGERVAAAITAIAAATASGRSSWAAWPAPATSSMRLSAIAGAICSAIARNLASRSPTTSVTGIAQLAEPAPQRLHHAGAEPAQRGGQPGRACCAAGRRGPRPRPAAPGRRTAAGRPTPRRTPRRRSPRSAPPAPRRRARRSSRSAASAIPGLAPTSTSRSTRPGSASAVWSAIRPPIE